jgi:SAM-dependent methyltransferase
METLGIETSKPIAYDSPDHIQPHGTASNNTTSPRFNGKLFEYIPAGEVRLLDIGCSGGGLVKSILDDGGFGIGIEGSDYSLKRRRAEWATIPDHLFTADATVPFQLWGEEDGRRRPLQFNVITAWEFFEHIAEHDLPGVIENIGRHLAPGGFVLGSISLIEDVLNGVRLHQTVQRKPWWIKTFARHGLEHHRPLEQYFNCDMVNGKPLGWSSAIALTRRGESVLYPEKLTGLIRRNQAYELMRSLHLLSRFGTLYYLAWLTKRKIESRLPGGRPFA